MLFVRHDASFFDCTNERCCTFSFMQGPQCFICLAIEFNIQVSSGPNLGR